MKPVAIITGTGSGIGKGIAKLLLQKNYLVYGYSRNNQIKNQNFRFKKIDLSKITSVLNLELPEINSKKVLLINNAATIGEIVPLDLKNDTDIITEYNLNLIAPTILCRKFIAKYSKVEKLIINISSGAANNSIESWSTYCATKAALDMLSKVISDESHPKLTTFSIHPGIVNTNMQKKIRGAKYKHFPLINKFKKYHTNNELADIDTVAKKLYYIIQNFKRIQPTILSIRDID